ncbi:class I SAM-dependent methyltransferase [Alkalibacterium iburiense]|uniref:Class I SAM-dependent methyltransferase n=1 Tax=Alkalibacterium iburiense TaxID=290589 RepID=A0ABP3HBG6_9LACT
MTYNWFARVYDDLMDDTLYEKWFAYTSRYLSSNATLLELGCGTGILGLTLKEKGYDVSGLDLSEDMLSLAYNRQQEHSIFFPLIQRDMRDLSELANYDGIVCYSDALCYMENENELLKVFREAYAHLNTNGYFLFDVHSLYQIELFLKTSFHAETDGIVFLWDSFEGAYPHSVEHELTFFVERDDQAYDRYEEVHKERTYKIDTYLELLRKAGFSNIEVTADFEESVNEKSKRWFFAAQKLGE